MSIPNQKAWQERLSSPLTLHCAGLVALTLVMCGILTWICIDWSFLERHSDSSANAKETELKVLKLETIPLRGLDKRIAETQEYIESFYSGRIPANYSSIAIRIGELEAQSGAHLSHLQYSQNPSKTNLTEISMDAGVTGTYPQIMRFVNELERNQNFFVIRSMLLTGQEGGLVSLRLRVSTWLRTADAIATGPTTTPKPNPSVAQFAAPGREGY